LYHTSEQNAGTVPAFFQWLGSLEDCSDKQIIPLAHLD
jgi:hypothetical protein